MPNLESIIKDPEERSRIKEHCAENYKYIRHAYKQCAGEDIINSFAAVGSGTFTRLMQNCGDYIDMKVIKTSDLDIAKSTVKGKDGNRPSHKNIPLDKLIRYNFLEIFIRLSKDRFIKTGQAADYGEAVDLQFQKYLIPYFGPLDSHIWRKKVLWTEENDLAIKRQYKTLMKLFDKYTSSNRAKRFMSADEFLNMLNESSIFGSDYFGRSEVFPLWNLSIMT